MRRLLVTRSHLALDRSDEYLRCWRAVRGAVTAAGGNAWLFRDSEHDDRFMEFIEWSGDASPLDDESVADTLDELRAVAPARHADQWEEAG